MENTKKPHHGNINFLSYLCRMAGEVYGAQPLHTTRHVENLMYMHTGASDQCPSIGGGRGHVCSHQTGPLFSSNIYLFPPIHQPPATVTAASETCLYKHFILINTPILIYPSKANLMIQYMHMTYSSWWRCGKSIPACLIGKYCTSSSLQKEEVPYFGKTTVVVRASTETVHSEFWPLGHSECHVTPLTSRNWKSECCSPALMDGFCLSTNRSRNCF